MSSFSEFFTNPRTGLWSGNKLHKRLLQEDAPINLKRMKLKDLQQELSEQQTQQVFSKPKALNFPIQTYFGSKSAFTRMMVDLMEVSNEIPHLNHGTKYLFVAIDVYTRYAFVVPLKTKTTRDCLAAMQSVYQSIGDLDNGQYLPTSSRYLELISDNESAFSSDLFKEFCQKHFIHQKFVRDDFKQKSMVERFIRTFRWLIHKYKLAAHTNDYYSVLQDLVYNYNHTWHRMLHTTPVQAIQDNHVYDNYISNRLTKLAQSSRVRHSISQSLAVGDFVRILTVKKHYLDPRKALAEQFQKEQPGWSVQVYSITRIENLQRHQLYFVKNIQSNRELLTPFRRLELMKINNSSLNQFEQARPSQNEYEQEEVLRHTDRAILKNLNAQKTDKPQESVLSELPVQTMRTTRSMFY